MNKNINFEYTTNFQLTNSSTYQIWIEEVLVHLGYSYTEINYFFCSDEDLLAINQAYLNHDSYTDIITFDHSIGKHIQTDISISLDRVKDNAYQLHIPFEDELRRVMIHGILHCCGFKDKTKDEADLMRSMEDECMKMFHVEHKQN